MIATLALFLAFSPQQQPTKPSDGVILTEASLAIGKRVCASVPDSSVWIYRDGWHSIPCSRLGEIFAIDTDNSFDALIPLMQSIHDDTPNK